MKRGTIALTPFPFTDLSSQKIRPAQVVSRSNSPGSDVILAFITSASGKLPSHSDLLVPASDPDFGLTGLKRDSLIRLDKLVTIDQSILLGGLGELSTRLLRQANEKLRYALGL